MIRFIVKARVDDNDFLFSVNENSCKYGNYVVCVQDWKTKDFLGYLYPDNVIRRRAIPIWTLDESFHAYCQTVTDAALRIKKYVEPRPKYKKGPGENMSYKKAIDDVITDFTGRKIMFTAFDVTKAVRAAQPLSGHIFHDTVKAHVHDQFDNGLIFPEEYEKELIDIANPQPWCYYIPGLHDPENYCKGVKFTPNPIPMPLPPNVSKSNKRVIMATFSGVKTQD